MVILNGNDYSNPYDKSNDNKTKIKEKITKIIKILLICVVIKMIEITTTIQIMSVIIIITMVIYKILLRMRFEIEKCIMACVKKP